MPSATVARLNASEDSCWETPARKAQDLTTALSSLDIALTVHEDLSLIENDWRDFEQSADCTVFQSFDWLATWQRHIGEPTGVRPAIVIGRDSANGILFILPLSTRSIGLSRHLEWLGGALNDYNAPLLAATFSNRVDSTQFKQLWRSITRLLHSQPRFRYDLIRFEKMPETVGGQSNPMLFLGVTLNPSGSYATPLAGSWDTFYTAKRSASTRRRDRTKRNRLADFGEIRFITMKDTRATLNAFSTLTEQKARSFARMGVANLFLRPGYTEFYRALATDSKTRHLTHISQLDVGSQTAAVNFGLTFRGRYYYLLASHSDGELSRFGPGAAHLHELLRYAIEHKFEAFDFTIGDEPYKMDWCDAAQILYDHMSAANWRGALSVASALTLQKFKRKIKQTPLLWNAFKKVRAMIGSVRS